jgi:gamma-glutamyltranspeptidase/glutathione hydrolase
MSPIIVLEDGKVRMVLGSPEGLRIIPTVTKILLSVADGGLSFQQAVDATRFHCQDLPDIANEDPWSNGECVNPKTGLLEGARTIANVMAKRPAIRRRNR